MNDTIQTEAPSETIAAPAATWPNRRRLWLSIAVGFALLIGGAWIADRRLRPEAPATLGVSIRTGADSTPVIKKGATDLFNQPRAADEHPLDQALAVAQAGLEFYRQTVNDYETVFVKQERVGGRLAAEERSFVKFRRGSTDTETNIPQSVYMRFLQPKSSAGREVIYVEGQNDGRLVAHEGGLLNVIRANLQPTSRLAMRGNRHPITEFGIEKLIERMIEKGSRDRQLGDCQVEVNRDIEINGHSGTEIKIIHPERSDQFEFHIARIIIDDEMNLPVGYEAYTWPEPGSDDPVLTERYFYTELRVNVGLGDHDFDPDNPEYHFP